MLTVNPIALEEVRRSIREESEIIMESGRTMRVSTLQMILIGDSPLICHNWARMRDSPLTCHNWTQMLKYYDGCKKRYHDRRTQ